MNLNFQISISNSFEISILICFKPVSSKAIIKYLETIIIYQSAGTTSSMSSPNSSSYLINSSATNRISLTFSMRIPKVEVKISNIPLQWL